MHLCFHFNSAAAEKDFLIAARGKRIKIFARLCVFCYSFLFPLEILSPKPSLPPSECSESN